MHCVELRVIKGVGKILGAQLLSVLVLLAGILPAMGADFRAAHLNPTGQQLNISWSIVAYDDVSGQLSAEEALHKARTQAFRPVPELSIYRPDVARWFHLRLDNPDRRKLAIQIKKTNYSALEIFEIRPGPTGERVVRTFEFTQKSWQDLFNPHYVYVLTDDVDQPARELMVRAESLTRLILPITVQPREFVAGDVAMSSIALGAYYGSIIIMMMYNAFLYFFIKDRVYIVYVVYLMFFALTQMSVDGYFPVLFQLVGWRWTGHIGVACGDLTLVFLTLYSRSFLALKENMPRLDKVALSATAVFIAALLSTPFLPYSIAVNITYLLNFFCSFVLLALGLGSFLQGYKPARYFILGNMLLIVASIIMALLLLGVMKPTLIDIYTADILIKLGSALEVVFFSFALADRVNLLSQEQQRDRESLHLAEVNRLESEKRIASEMSKANQYMVLAHMTQSLAHDIRKPFSMLKIGLDRLSSVGDDPVETRAMVNKIRFHVGKSFDDVNRTINDVMEASSGPANLHLEERSIAALAVAALTQTFKYHPNVEIDFRADLQHRHLCRIDEHKVLRVLVNVFDNARQAMNGKGTITISTAERMTPTGPVIEVGIRNSGSFIESEHLESIFEPFFTKGKRGGTGLGLAICRKIIEAHGGRIACTSSRVEGTEFRFTLPAILGLEDAESVVLPTHAQEIRKEFERSLASEGAAPTDHARSRRTRAALERMAELGRPFRILVIDDEQIYADGIKSLCQGANDELRIDVTYSEDPLSGIALAESEDFDLIVCDIDFPGKDINGYEVIEQIRQIKPAAKLCAHSNRILPSDYRRAINAGADAYLPKPMTYPHLVGLLAGDKIVDSKSS